MTNIRLFVRSLAGAIAVAALSVAAAAPSHAQQFTMKFSTLTLNDIQHENLKLYKEELEKVTGGRIKVEVYPAGQLGGAPRQTEGLRLGTIEAAMGPPELFFGADRRFQVLAMAGLFKDNAHARKVLDNQAFRKIFSDFSVTRGMVPMGYHVYDHQMFVFRTPVTNLAGFAGKRTRVLASEAEQAAVASLGAAPVPMSLPEVVPALQQGTIDGCQLSDGRVRAIPLQRCSAEHRRHRPVGAHLDGDGQQDLVRRAAGRTCKRPSSKPASSSKHRFINGRPSASRTTPRPGPIAAVRSPSCLPPNRRTRKSG